MTDQEAFSPIVRAPDSKEQGAVTEIERIVVGPHDASTNPLDRLRLLESVFAASPDVISVISGDGVVAYVSDAVSNLFGMSKESVIGSSVYDMDSIHPDDQEQLRAASRRLLGGEVMTDRVEVPCPHPDGHIVAIEARRKIVLDDDLQVSGGGLRRERRERAGRSRASDVSGEPGEERVPVADEPRAAHPAQLDSRIRSAARARRPHTRPVREPAAT